MNNLPIPRLVQICCASFPELEALYLFGSEARGEAWPDSDLDLALLLPTEQAKAAGSLALSDLAWELSKELDRKVDLVNLRTLSTVFQMQVISNGKVLYTKDPERLYEFEALVLSLYQHLKEERAAIEREIMRTGEIYAP
ncbi:MAG: nucleotidyltransferase domain-containing protein [bacterium]|nr:nucleotidyltransferase domain-containing protein [bacterium]